MIYSLNKIIYIILTKRSDQLLSFIFNRIFNRLTLMIILKFVLLDIIETIMNFYYVEIYSIFIIHFFTLINDILTVIIIIVMADIFKR